jgi:hypothetical protein
VGRTRHAFVVSHQRFALRFVLIAPRAFVCRSANYLLEGTRQECGWTLRILRTVQMFPQATAPDKHLRRSSRNAWLVDWDECKRMCGVSRADIVPQHVRPDLVRSETYLGGERARGQVISSVATIVHAHLSALWTPARHLGFVRRVCNLEHLRLLIVDVLYPRISLSRTHQVFRAMKCTHKNIRLPFGRFNESRPRKNIALLLIV